MSQVFQVDWSEALVVVRMSLKYSSLNPVEYSIWSCLVFRKGALEEGDWDSDGDEAGRDGRVGSCEVEDD